MKAIETTVPASIAEAETAEFAELADEAADRLRAAIDSLHPA